MRSRWHRESNPIATRSGPKPLARQHHPRPARRRARSSATSTSYSVTGLTSNPTIFDHAIKNSAAYDDAIRDKLERGQVGREAVLRTGAGGPHAGRRSVPADLRPNQAASMAGCRWKSRRCWPTTRKSRSPRPRTCTRGRGRPNLFIKIPGTKEGLPAIEEAIFAGIPINVTLLFSARALPRGRRRIHARHRAAHRCRA